MTAARRILVVGSGGREHALAWRLARDPGVEEVLVAPGHDGVGRRFRRVAVREGDVPGLIEACRREAVTLVVIGPEAPLAAGLADGLAAAGIAVFGPSAAAARLESSKWAAKEIMMRAGVPTAAAERFEDAEAARRALPRYGPPWVIKADGLAAGKGVRVTHERAEAEAFLGACLSGAAFGDAGRSVVLESFLDGEEASVMTVTDGREFVLLPAARDYKRAEDGDRGSNTGGMGAYAPAAGVDAGLEREIGARIVGPVLRAMAAQGTPFRGLLYAGLMITATGPQVVEFNVRFGDPETQVVLPLLDGDLAGLLAGVAAGALDPGLIKRRAGAAVGVALVADGYPERPRTGGIVEGLESLEAGGETLVFHAGSAWNGERWTVRGGRVATVVAQGGDREQARRRCYAAIGTLSGSGWRCRGDIARTAAVAVARTAAREDG